MFRLNLLILTISTTPHSRLPQKHQTFIYQPAHSPYLDYPLVALKQDGGETNWIIQGGQNFYQLIFGSGMTEGNKNIQNKILKK